MSQAKSVVMLAGAVLSLGGVNAALAQQTTDEVRAIVAEMKSEAETRSSLLAAGGAGHDGQFYLADSTGNFRLNVGGQIQFRYLMNFRDEDNTIGARAGDDFEPGFQTRRTKIWFKGNIINEDWEYKIQLAADRAEGSTGLEDAWVRYNFGNGFKARWGQFKAAFLREENVSSTKQLAAERSVTNEIFNQDYTQGIEVSYEPEEGSWRIMGSFNDGFASRNSDFTASPLPEADIGLTGRFEFKFSGDWNDFEDFTAEKGQAFGALVGAAFHYQDSANSNNPADVDAQYIGYTIDGSLEGDGWNVFAAFLGRHIDSRGPVGSGNNPDLDDFGVVVQGGYRVVENTEIFARYDGIYMDDDRFGSGEEDFHFITFGVNQYYAKHAAKATIDAVISFEDTSNLVGASPFANGGFPSTGTGMLGTSEDTEILIRFQFQLLF